jgi:ribokinase
VATLAGVSIGTVSNVLTSRRGVRPETRAKIDAAIRTLGFVPDLAARSLIARRGRARPPTDPAAPRLTCVGYVCADHTARLAVLPHRDDRATALDIEKTLGGCAANVAVTAAGLGPPYPVAVDVLSVLGDDPDSDWATALLAESRGGTRPGLEPSGVPAFAMHHLGRGARCPDDHQRAATGSTRGPEALARGYIPGAAARPVRAG